MASLTAQTGYLAYGRQTAQGTGAAPTRGYRTTSTSISGQAETVVPDPESGSGRDIPLGGAIPGPFSVSGSADAYLYVNQLAGLLPTFGFVQSGAPVALPDGVYEHTFIPGDQAWTTLEAAWGDNLAIRRWEDCLGDTMSLTAPTGAQATASLGFVGIKEEWKPTPSVPTFGNDPSGSWMGSALRLPGIGTMLLSETMWELANNLSTDEYVLESRFLTTVTPKRRDITGSATARLGDNPTSVTDAYRAAMYGDTTRTTPGTALFTTDATAIFGSGQLIGTSATQLWRLEIEMPAVEIQPFPLEGSGDDVLTASFTYRAYSNGTDPVATIKVYSDRATAY